MFYCSVADPDPDPLLFCPPESGTGMGKNTDQGSGMSNEHPRTFFRELRNSYFSLKILKFFDADCESGPEIVLALDPGANIPIRGPDPQHCFFSECVPSDITYFYVLTGRKI